MRYLIVVITVLFTACQSGEIDQIKQELNESKLLVKEQTALIKELKLQDGKVSEKDSLAIWNTMLQQQKDWNNFELEAYMQGYWQSSSLTFMGKNGVTKGWQNTLDGYKRGYPNKDAVGKLTFGLTSMQQIGYETVLLIGSWNLERKTGPIGGYFSLIWKKKNNKWVIVLDHTS